MRLFSTHHARAGFTMVELAVVLAVIALIIGGVTQGQALLRKSKLQSAMRDFSKYGGAYDQFVTVYKGKPGDIINAAALWTGSTSGDGNGYVAGPYTAGALTNLGEVLQAWQHLSSAQLIEGSYSGTGAPAIGVNVPRSAVDGGSYVFLSQNPITDATSRTNSPNYFDGAYGSGHKPGTFILFGAVGGTLTDAPILTPRDAHAIDSKLDDGLPAVGIVLTSLNSTCAMNPSGALAADNGRNALYDQNVSTRVCNLIYINHVVKDG